MIYEGRRVSLVYWIWKKLQNVSIKNWLKWVLFHKTCPKCGIEIDKIPYITSTKPRMWGNAYLCWECGWSKHEKS